MSFDLECVLDAKADLGESPVWSAREQALHWADINGGMLHRFVPSSGVNSTIALGESVGSFCLTDQGGYLAALRSGIWHLAPDGARLGLLAHPLKNHPHQRLNDGRCDAQGRFWVGGMDESRQRHDTALYRLDAQGSCHKVLSPLSISNGLAFSPDGATLYHTDTPSHRIHAYALDRSTGALGPARLFHHFENPEDRPDGAAVDSLGRYWVALYGAGRIACISPEGTRLFDLTLPCLCPTMVAFGGPDLKTLYVTSARQKRSDEELKKWPLSGGLFSVRVEVAGLHEPVWPSANALHAKAC